jgi:hypothetical protein
MDTSGYHLMDATGTLPKPEPEPEPETPKKKPPKKPNPEPKKKEHEVKEFVEPKEVEPVISRMTKKKRFRPQEVKPKKKKEEAFSTDKASSLNAAEIETDSVHTAKDSRAEDSAPIEVTLPSKGSIPAKGSAKDSVPARGSAQDEDSVPAKDSAQDEDYIPIEYFNAVDLVTVYETFARDFQDTLQFLKSTCKTGEEYQEEFKKFGKKMTPNQFCRVVLNPMANTAQSLLEGIQLELELDKTKDSFKWSALKEQVKRVIGVFNESLHNLTAPKLDFKPPVATASVDKKEEELKTQTGLSFDNYQHVLQGLQKTCAQVIQSHKITLESVVEFEKPEKKGEPIPPEAYLEQLLSTIHDLVFQATPRQSESTIKIRKRLQRADPLYALAAATGIDPMELTQMSKKQQLDFVLNIQKIYPDPIALITTILECGPELDFTSLLNTKQRTEEKITTLERLLLLNSKEHSHLERKYNKIQEANNEWRLDLEKLYGLDKMDIDEDEWIDE